MKRNKVIFPKWAIIVSEAVVSAIIMIGAVMVYELPQEQVHAASGCSVDSISSTNLIKTYHLLDLTDGFGVTPTKDGGFLLTGDTIPAMGMAPPFPFVIKTDAKGSLVWSKWFGSQSSALGSMSSSRRGRLTAQTADGNIVTANDITDFVDEKTKELYGDILVTKLNPKGGLLWSILLGDYSLDRPQKLWALPDGGVMMLSRLFKTGFGDDVVDSDTIARYGALIKIDKNGKVVSAKKMNWDAEDMERLADGSFIALANISLPQVDQLPGIMGPELTPHALPTIIRLNKNLEVVWAKSMEMIPSEINSIASISGNSFTMGKTKIRMPGGDFRAVESTPDGGFIAIGFDNLALTQGFYGSLDTSSVGYSKPRPLVAVKVDADGHYLWTKKLTTSLASGISTNDFQVVKTVDGQFVILQDAIRDSAGIEAKSQSAGQAKKDLLTKCAELKSDCLDPANIVGGAKAEAEAENKAMKIWSEALANNIALIKTDADFNPRWVKKIDAERNLSGFGIAPTSDKGVVIAGSMLTTKQHLVFQTLEPYKEATLIKVDANGQANGCASVSDQSQATVQELSQYLVMADMNASTANLKLNINKKVKARFSNIKNTARDICKYQKKVVTPVCSYLTPNTDTISSGEVSAPVAETWASINFAKAKEGKIEKEKNQQIHNELLPILQEVFGQAKMTDSMNSMWLAYIFPRLVTRADVEAVGKKYQALGYKIDESEEGRLFVSKVGLTLHMTFSIQNSMVGKLEVLF